MSELAVLQGLRLKGRCTSAAVAATSGLPHEDALALLEALRADGYVSGDPARLTPAGRERLGALTTEERTTIDGKALGDSYREFDAHNRGLKATITAWQIDPSGEPNDHADLGYDQQVIRRLIEGHASFSPLLARMVALVPRLEPYGPRFDHAIAQIEAGDLTWVARPIQDSYHTLWFELHEDLMALLELSRTDEAIAGRAG